MLQAYFEAWEKEEPERARRWHMTAFVATGVCVLLFFLLLFYIMSSTDVHAACAPEHPALNASMFRPGAPAWCDGLVLVMVLLLMASIAGGATVCI
jgi:hypothetical protein